MKKINARNVSNPVQVGRRVLKLARETVKVLSADELARAAGGSACVTPSFTSDTGTTHPNTSTC